MVVRAGLSGAPYLMRLQRWEAASALLERVGQRDKAPSTLAAILPLLRRIADATKGRRGDSSMQVFRHNFVRRGSHCGSRGHDARDDSGSRSAGTVSNRERGRR